MGRVGPSVVCVGANEESGVALDGLYAAGARVTGLVTLPRHKPNSVCDYVDLTPWCKARSIPVIETTNINDSGTIQSILDLAPDFIFTLGWSQLFQDQLLSTPTSYVVGSHPSPLPMGRGRAPVPWTILEGQVRSAVSLFRMDAGVDSGDILQQRWFDIPDRVYAAGLYEIVATSLSEAFCALYHQLSNGTVRPIAQDESKATYRPKRTPEDGAIDFNRSAIEIDRLIRAVSHPYPGAFCSYRTKALWIWHVDPGPEGGCTGSPGEILQRKDGRLLVQCGQGQLWVSNFTCNGEPVQASTFQVGSQLEGL
jgi:methionyl-tRNA formyltransferase